VLLRNAPLFQHRGHLQKTDFVQQLLEKPLGGNALSNPVIPGKIPPQSDGEGIDRGRWIMGFGTNSFRGKNCKEPIPSSRNRAICHWHIAVNSSNPIHTNKKKGYQTVSFLFMAKLQ